MIRILSLLVVFLAANASSEVSVWAINENGKFDRQVQGKNADFVASFFVRELGLPRVAVPVYIQADSIYFEDYLDDVRDRQSSNKYEIVYFTNLEIHQGKVVAAFHDERIELDAILAEMREVSDTKFFIF